MGSEEGRIIKPPMEDVTKGKVFKPDTRFCYKEWFTATVVAIFVWMLTVGVLILGAWIYMMDQDAPWSTFFTIFFDVLPILSFWYALSLVVWWLPAMIGIPLYIRSIEYSVISKSGMVMPEIYVKKGLINVTRKHVPFRTITNISSRAGPIDRLFGIGTVEIQTAGYSGGAGGQTGPEEKLEGITFYEEVRDFILQELRKFRDPYVTGTEVVLPREEPVPRLSDSLDDEMLITLREIRDVLERIENKLD
ncbi:MAG: PH domain-containing protein [Candidatus Thorarchaeota archaeon]|nr:PH domain-containing protein [Candidatus Thorarchaeota archaeon]